jgi:hypothetical protein
LKESLIIGVVQCRFIIILETVILIRKFLKKVPLNTVGQNFGTAFSGSERGAIYSFF